MSKPVRELPWKFAMARAVTLQGLLDASIAELRSDLSVAIATPDGVTIHMRALGPADIATLPQAALACQRYLKLRDGELAIVNDLASGGTSLSDVTLVTAVGSPGAAAVDFLVAVRLRFSPRWGKSGKLDEEGVRIPPTPLGTLLSINRDLIAAISSHPLSPGLELLPAIESAVSRLLLTSDKLKSLSLENRLGFGPQTTKDTIAVYMQEASRGWTGAMARLPLGTANVTTRIPLTNEQIKLHLEVTENKIHFDFKGSDQSSRVGLTELSTFGGCVASTLAIADADFPISSGVFEHFQVSAPTGTLLSARAPIGTVRGIEVLLPLLCELVQEAFAKLNRAPAHAGAAAAPSWISVDFKDGRRLSTFASPGGGANAAGAGLNARTKWTRRMNVDLEKIESAIPLTFTSIGLNKDSGGKGQFKGGSGGLVSFRVDAEATLRWLIEPQNKKHAGLSSGQGGKTNELTVVSVDGKQTELTDADGEFSLKAGDQVVVRGAGGGGYGAVPASEAAKDA